MSNFVWYDLMTSDYAAAASFYHSVLGWDANASDVDPTYGIFSLGETMIAGLLTIREAVSARGTRPVWTGYIYVDDVDESAKRVVDAGGRIGFAPDDIPGIGRWAVAHDPDGATFVLFKPLAPAAGPPAPVPVGTPGHVGWHELQADDRERTFAFYSGLFGWKDAGASELPFGTYQMFATDTVPVGGILQKFPDVPAAFWLYYFNVDAVGAAVESVKANGGQVLRDPEPVPGGSWIVGCVDPQGALFALVGAKL
jgi:predicted enzyme related to lactoylglutathione lyase